MTRARTDVAEIERDLVACLATVRKALPELVDGTPLDEAWASIETFCAVSLRVMRHSNPSKIRDAAMAEEIKARIDGRAVQDGLQHVRAA